MLQHFCVSDGQNANFQPRQAPTITGWTTEEDYREEEDGKNEYLLKGVEISIYYDFAGETECEEA